MGKRRRRTKSKDAGAMVAAAILAFISFSQSRFFWLIVIALMALAVAIWLLTRAARTTDAPHAAAAPASMDASRWSLELMKRLDWKRFEELCTWYFQETGYKAKVSDFGADGGVDIVIYDPAQPDMISGVVQCKAWTNKQVGVKEIRELFGVMNDVGCPNGVFVGMSGFTPDARAFAANKAIDLVSAEQLLDLIAILPADVQSRLLQKTTDGDYATPSCPSCGIKLVLRTVSKGSKAGRDFWGCRNYPRCRYIMNTGSA